MVKYVRTKYSNMSTSELLLELESRRVSPIINELCSRLEDKPVVEESTVEITNTVTKCPVCETSIKVGYSESDGVFTLNATNI